MSKIAGEINAEMMHPKVIHEQRKALFAEMVRKTGSQQSVLDRLLQEIQFLRDHEGGPMDEEVIDILRGKVAELEAENTLHKSAMDNLAAKLTEAERQRDELKAAIKNFLCAWDNCRSSGEWPVRRLEELRAAIAKGERNG